MAKLEPCIQYVYEKKTHPDLTMWGTLSSMADLGEGASGGGERWPQVSMAGEGVWALRSSGWFSVSWSDSDSIPPLQQPGREPSSWLHGSPEKIINTMYNTAEWPLSLKFGSLS